MKAEYNEKQTKQMQNCSQNETLKEAGKSKTKQNKNKRFYSRNSKQVNIQTRRKIQTKGEARNN